jgi:glycosyltransferase involved in cell wall biosynthesis
MERPLISLVLIAFNQERFIKHAVESALGQTYSPLEIILSDDCSTDGTFEIMQEMATRYSGCHRIVLNRNNDNQGLATHVSTALDISKGSLIVLAAGDDVSLPQRVERLFQAWDRGGRRAVSIYSSALQIGANGFPCETGYDYDKPCHPSDILEVLRMETAHVVGATQAISRALWERYGAMSDGCHEDEILPFRALLMDGICFIPDRLVLYRTHETNFWNRNCTETPQESLRRLQCIYRGKLAIRNQWLADYCQSPHSDSRIKSGLLRLVEIAEHQLLVIQRGFLQAILLIVCHTLKTGSPRGANILIYKSKLKWRSYFG